MSTGTNPVWDALETWNTRAFLVAGILAFCYGVLKGLKAYGGLEVVTAYDVIYGGFVLFVPVLALLGLYPRVREASPWSSIGAVVLSVIAGIGTVAITLQVVYMTVTMAGYPEIPGDGPAWPVVVLGLVFISIALAFLLSGFAAMRSEAVSGTVAGLLLVPFLSWFGLIVANVVLPSGDYLGMYAYAPIGVALLGIAYLQRSSAVGTDSADAASDSTVG